MLKLLLVDDEPIFRDAIQAVLPFERNGLKLSGSCGNAFDAMDSMADDMPDILISDVRMPPMDGLELIERAMKLNPKLRCVVLSGYSEFSYAQKAMSLGVRDYLVKPSSQEELTQVIERICQEIRIERQQLRTARHIQMEDVARLAEQLLDIALSTSDTDMAVESVRRIAKEAGNDLILRDAFTYMIAHYEKRTEQGIETLQLMYDESVDLTELVAKRLMGMQIVQNNRRGFVNDMCNYIQQHYQDENLSLQYLAEHVIFMQADYIGREFKRDTGRKLSSYLLEVRMEKAKKMLAGASGKCKVADVAAAVGLGSNPHYFHALFRRYTGQTPKEYSKSQE